MSSASSAGSLPPSYSPLFYSPSSLSSSSSSSLSPAASLPTVSLPLPPPPPPSSSTARLTDLCPADKAKVGKLLLRVATLQAETQRHSDAEFRLKAIEEERSRLQAQKADVEQRLDQSMRLLKAYQDRVMEADQRSHSDQQQRARQDAEQRDSQHAHSSPVAPTPAPVQVGRREEGIGGGEEKEQLVDPAHLHRLLHEQKVRIQRRMEELQRCSSPDPPFPPPSRRTHSHSPPTRRSFSPLVQHADGEAVLSASVSSSSSHRPHSSHGSSRPHPVTVSVRYTQRDGHSGSVSEPPRVSISSTSKHAATHGNDVLRRPRTIRPASPLPPPHSTLSAQGHRGREQGKGEEEDEEDEARLLSQSSSPISRRIQRLLDIQHGSSLRASTPPPPPSRPFPAARPAPRSTSHLPPPSAVRRPFPLHFPPASSLASSVGSVSSRRTAPSASLDEDEEAVVEALNGSVVHESEGYEGLSARLRRYDVALLDTISALE